MRILFAALLAPLLAAPSDHDWPAPAYRGVCVEGAGDTTGDGFPEVVIGSWTERKVWVVSAKKGKLLYELKEKKGDFGWSVSSIGDATQDGVSDIAVGSPETDTVRTYKGRKGKEMAEIEGEKGSRFGWDVGAAGDTNGDGFAEVVVAARGDGKEVRGGAMLFVARTGDQIHDFTKDIEGACDVFAVAGVGDTNSDGFSDIAVGMPFGGNGQVLVYSGKDAKLLQTVEGESPDEGFGMAVSGAGDIDADGFRDFVIGAPFGADGFGRIVVVSGKTGNVMWEAEGSRPGERFGHSVNGAGDLNLDGRSDIVVGAPGAPRDLTVGPIVKVLAGLGEDPEEKIAKGGRVTVLSGRGGTVLMDVRREEETDWFGITADGVGDANGDGRSDIVVGADVFDARKDDHLAVARILLAEEGEEMLVLEDGKQVKKKKRR